MKIIENREKYHGKTSLTNYCMKSYKNIKNSFELRNGAVKKSVKSQTHISFNKFDKFLQEKLLIKSNEKASDLETLELFKLLNKKSIKKKKSFEDTWTGLQDVMESYHKYASGKFFKIFTYALKTFPFSFNRNGR